MKYAVIVVLIIIAAASVLFLRNSNQMKQNQTTEGTQTVQLQEPERKPSMVQQNTVKQFSAPPEMKLDSSKTYKATITTNKGILYLKLFADEAPKTVNNFVFLAKEGYYNNTPFHRVISGFMIQGGDPTGTGTGGPGYRFDDEKITREYKRGTIAMANAGPNTNGSQFFIMHKDSNSLPKAYVIFGAIDESDTSSFSVLDTLLDTPVVMSMSGERSKPTEDIRILEVTIQES